MDDPCFYGFPTYGEAGPKAAEDCGGRPVDPDRRTFDRDETAFAQRRRRSWRDHLPGALGPPIYTRRPACTRSRRTATSWSTGCPRHPGVSVALGAAHGFKFASVIGRILAELSVDGSTPSAPDIARFRIDRPILLEADPPTSWMV